MRKLGWDGFRAKFDEEWAEVERVGRRVQVVDTAGGETLVRPPRRLPVGGGEVCWWS